MGFFRSWIREIGGIVAGPSAYYDSLDLGSRSKTAGPWAQILKALIFGALSGGLFFLFRDLLGLNMTFGWIPLPRGWMAVAAHILAAPAGLLTGAAWILVLSDMGRGNSEYRDALKAAAPLLFLGPLGVAAAALGTLDTRVSLLLEIALTVYMLALVYRAAVRGLRARKDTVLAVLIVAGLFLAGGKAVTNAAGGSAKMDADRLGQIILDIISSVQADGGEEFSSGSQEGEFEDAEEDGRDWE